MQSKGNELGGPCKLEHDLRNKLDIILGYCTLLFDRSEEGSEWAERLGRIREAAEQMVEKLERNHCQRSNSEGKWPRQPAKWPQHHVER